MGDVYIMRRTYRRKTSAVEIVRVPSGSWSAADLLESLPGPAACLAADLTVSLANRAFADRYRLPPEEVVGKAAAALDPSSHGQLARLARRVLENRRPWRAFASSLLPASGREPGDEDLLVVPIHAGAGDAPSGILLLTLDARDRQRLEQALRDRKLRDTRERMAEEQIGRLRHLDKLKTDFLSAASHELRTPLSAILGYAELLSEGVVGELTQQQLAFSCEIMRATQRLHHLIDDLLDFAQLEAGALVVAEMDVNVCALTAEAAEALRPEARELGLTLEVKVVDPPLRAYGDGRRLGRAISHLIENAMKFTARGGWICAKVERRGNDVVVEVRDNGIGIPKTHQAHIFDRFYQVDSGSTRQVGGTGIGLSLVRAIAEAHGGRVGVRSTPGRGSTFWLSLPAVH